MAIGTILGYNQSESALGMKSPERCKPDYELIIKKLNQESAAIHTALDGLLRAHYAEYYIPGELTLPQAIGFLYLKSQDCLRAIEATIKAQEAESQSS
jgi:hypothetical protein